MTKYLTLDVKITFKSRRGFLGTNPIRKTVGAWFLRMASRLLDCDIEIDGDWVRR